MDIKPSIFCNLVATGWFLQCINWHYLELDTYTDSYTPIYIPTHIAQQPHLLIDPHYPHYAIPIHLPMGLVAWNTFTIISMIVKE